MEIEQIKICEDVTFAIHKPEVPCTVKEADDLCKRLRQEGWYCGIIYCYRDMITGKRYIGQTMYPWKRYITHINNAKREHPDTAFGSAIKKYGHDRFKYQVLDVVKNKDENQMHLMLDKKEQERIIEYDSSTSIYGYNVAKGGWEPPKHNKVEKAVDQFDLSGNFIRTYHSLSKANATMGFTGSSIRSVCNHKTNTAGGYLWAWHGEQPVLPQENHIYSYDDEGNFMAEYNNAFAASKSMNMAQGGIWKALQDKWRLACNMYWRDYKADKIPLSDFPNAIYAYDLDGNFIKGFPCLAKAKLFTNDKESSSISHAIIRKTAHKGYLWRNSYANNIDPSDGRFINKAAVIAIFPDGTTKRYDMIKDAAADTQTDTSSIQHSIKKGNITKKGLKFIRA